ncbi:MAG: esterase-like activity of phytase family protein [Bauldia sp.]|nr:esterase-like activity of phytase family protein [Bauldia sp.]
MNRRASLLMLSASAFTTATAGAYAQGAPFYERISTYPVFQNLDAGVNPATATVAEIVTATPDGMMLVHSDSPGNAIGFVDITDPTAPVGAGRVDVGGEPTSVVSIGSFVLAGVNTSASFVEPSGHVAVVAIADQTITATCDVKGQPDSLAVSPDGTFLAVVVENERDEDVNDAMIPQLPSGHLAIFSLGADGMPVNCDAAVIVDLTGLSEIAPDDAEPEYVDINTQNVAVVAMQENNWIAIVDLATGTVTNSFSAGAVDLTAIDVAEDGIVQANGTLTAVPREPDAVQWIDDTRFVTANEGDYEGGSRGFTIFNVDGTVEYDAGNAFEHLGMMIGHFPEGRADAKGTEPEGAEVAHLDGETLLFIGSERANFVAVYRDMGAGNAPEFIQVLPTNIGPEGLLAIESRGLFVVATEEDAAEDNIRSTISVYAKTADAPVYPQIVSATDPATGAPLGWGALSGLVADATNPNVLYAVSDSAYAVSRIYTIDTSAVPAVITSFVTLTKDGGAVPYDLEGIALRAGGGFWVASEGGAETENLLLAVGADGTVLDEIRLPEAVEAAATNNGYEGVATYTVEGQEMVVVAQQRAWADDAENRVKLAIYNPATAAWTFVAYELSTPTSPNGGWVGLSEITHLGDARFAIIERDNQPGVYSTYKVVTVVDLATVTARPAGEALETVAKTEVIDLLAAMLAGHGWISDKVEGLAVTVEGTVYAVIDNDGVDDAPGETQFLTLGNAADLFD